MSFCNRTAEPCVGVGFIPILSAKHNVGVGFIPIHQAQQRLTASERLVLRNPRLSERSECSLG